MLSLAVILPNVYATTNVILSNYMLLYFCLFIMQMEYIKTQSKAKDDKLLAIGHSMGGILLYAMLSRCGKQLHLLFLYMVKPISFHAR